jgi:L-iditol 2-dehydrogenase
LVQKNITLRGSFSHHWSIWEKVIGMLTTEQLDVEPIVGGTWPLQEWHQAFEAMHSGQIVKAQLVP